MKSLKIPSFFYKFKVKQLNKLIFVYLNRPAPEKIEQYFSTED